MPVGRQRHGESGDEDQSPGGFLREDVADAQDAQSGPDGDGGEQSAQSGFEDEGNKGRDHGFSLFLKREGAFEAE